MIHSAALGTLLGILYCVVWDLFRHDFGGPSGDQPILDLDFFVSDLRRRVFVYNYCMAVGAPKDSGFRI